MTQRHWRQFVQTVAVATRADQARTPKEAAVTATQHLETLGYTV